MEKKSVLLDQIDLKILRMLQEDASLTNKQIAARLELTVTPVFERIKSLHKEGYIRKYAALLDRKRSGFELLVFCEVSIKEHNKQYLKKFEKEVKDLPEVMECHHVTGAFDYLLKIVVSSMDKYQHFIKEKLAGIDHIGRVESHFVMSEIKNSTAFPV
jgi:Lrp/AsnC family leucine-responsive transcriptional regulator